MSQSETMQSLPAAQSVRVIDFTEARVVSDPLDPSRHYLMVSGEKPYLNMRVELTPLIYIKQPEYWGIEVVGSLPGIGLPAVAPYTAHIDLTGITGTAGIEVIGATRTEKIEVPRRG